MGSGGSRSCPGFNPEHWICLSLARTLPASIVLQLQRKAGAAHGKCYCFLTFSKHCRKVAIVCENNTGAFTQVLIPAWFFSWSKKCSFWYDTSLIPCYTSTQASTHEVIGAKKKNFQLIWIRERTFPRWAKVVQCVFLFSVYEVVTITDDWQNPL